MGPIPGNDGALGKSFKAGSHNVSNRADLVFGRRQDGNVNIHLGVTCVAYLQEPNKQNMEIVTQQHVQ